MFLPFPTLFFNMYILSVPSFSGFPCVPAGIPGILTVGEKAIKQILKLSCSDIPLSMGFKPGEMMDFNSAHSNRNDSNVL